MEVCPITKLFPALRRHWNAWRYIMAILLAVLFVAFRWLLNPVMGDAAPFALLSIPIVVASFCGGFGPGLTALLTIITLANYLVIPPLYSVGFSDLRTLADSLLFSVSGLAMAAMGELARRAVIQASAEAEIGKLAQRQSQLNHERFHIAEHLLACGTWDWDTETGAVIWSDGFRRLYDFPLDEPPLRQTWIEHMHPDDREPTMELLDEMLQQKLCYWSMEYRIVTASGRVRWVAGSGRAFYDDFGRLRRVVGVCIDISARKFAEATLPAETRARAV